MPPFPLNSGFLSIREIERDQYLCITNNHPVSERIKTTPYGIIYLYSFKFHLVTSC
ncbi:hypothetical protein TRKP064_p0047 (plasmid) [Klebsiella pneumoniae]|uniref:Uncharacterized protein n=1 Tax=Citrobacter braakii TaxID=57706 RepID=A0A3Q8VL13_CITBR|nr:Hypothetical protein [Citrobacter braakii]BBE64683.1 hypothetical protein TRKP064_p0047 [Klebsiella pneumoniae]